MSTVRVVFYCDQCKKVVRDRSELVKIRERDPRGVLNGKEYELCRRCEKDYYTRQIKSVIEKMGTNDKTLKLLGLTPKDVKEELDTWNKSKWK